MVFVPRARVVATATKKRSAKKRATCSLAAAMVVGGGSRLLDWCSGCGRRAAPARGFLELENIVVLPHVVAGTKPRT